MKKLLFCAAFTLILATLMAFGVFAAETVLETDSLAEIKDAIAASEAGDSIVVNMTGDILIPKQADAIVIDKDITVTFNFNGNLLFNNGGGGTAGKAYGIILKSFDAKLVMNGTIDVDPFNYDAPTDQRITVSNGQIVNPNKEAGVKSPDYASDGPAIVVFSGSIELYDMYITQYNGGEWTIFFAPYLDKTDVVHNIKAVNSIIKAPSSRYAALGTRQGSGFITECTVEIEDCVVYGTSNEEWLSMGANSYIKNSRIALNSFKIDSYMSSGYAHDGQEAVLENVIFENPKLTSNTGAIYVKMINCQFPNGMNLYVTGDSKGKTKFTVIQDPTCENGGGTYFVELTKGNGKTYTSYSQFPTIIEELPALGHENTVIVAYENGYLESGYRKEGCSRCTQHTTEVLLPLFTTLGFSVPEDGGTSISVGFVVNREAIEIYNKATDITVSYGVFAVSQSKLGEGDLFDENLVPSSNAIIQAIDDANNVFLIKVTGFSTEAQKSAPLAIGGYVIAEDGDTKTVSYIQADKPQNGAKYSFKSFNDYQK